MTYTKMQKQLHHSCLKSFVWQQWICKTDLEYLSIYITTQNLPIYQFAHRNFRSTPAMTYGIGIAWNDCDSSPAYWINVDFLNTKGFKPRFFIKSTCWGVKITISYMACGRIWYFYERKCETFMIGDYPFIFCADFFWNILVGL